MDSSQIKQLRKQGKLKEALRLARAGIANDPDNIWGKRAIAWVYYEYLKLATQQHKSDDFFKQAENIKDLNLPDTEKTLFDSVAWQTGKLLFAIDKPDTEHLNTVFELVKSFSFSKQTDSYTFLLKAFTKHSPIWKHYLKFTDWWGLENFHLKDYKQEKLQNGQQILSVVERTYIAISKKLLNPPVDIVKVEQLLPVIARLCNEHPEMQYPHYYHAKLLIVSGNKQRFLKAFVPFARKKRRDFWVWDLMSEVYDKGEPLYFACLCRSLLCKVPVKFSLNVKEKMAELLIEKKLLPEAKSEIEDVVNCRNSQQWRITENLKKWPSSEWWAKTKATKNNEELYKKYASPAEGLLYFDIDEDIIVVENVNTEKRILSFIASKEKQGFFSYRFFDINPEPGDVLSARFIGPKDKTNSNYYKVATVSKTDKRPASDIYQVIEANIRIKPGNSFGFVNSSFVPPDLISRNKFKNGDLIKVAVVMSFNKKRKQWGWKAVKMIK